MHRHAPHIALSRFPTAAEYPLELQPIGALGAGTLSSVGARLIDAPIARVLLRRSRRRSAPGAATDHPARARSARRADRHTLGGYSQRIVVHERYMLRIRHPEAQLAAVAPLLCAGITTYSPPRHWKVGPGQKVGVVGIGGLGHMGSSSPMR